jgi:hypothetical protein
MSAILAITDPLLYGRNFLTASNPRLLWANADSNTSERKPHRKPSVDYVEDR